MLRGPELFAEEDVLRRAVGVEEAAKACPGGARAPVGALNEPEQIIGEGRHKPQGYVDVVCEQIVERFCRHGALSDVVQRLVHGEEKFEYLIPPGEIGTGSCEFEIYVVGDLDVADAETRGSRGVQGGIREAGVGEW